MLLDYFTKTEGRKDRGLGVTRTGVRTIIFSKHIVAYVWKLQHRTRSFVVARKYFKPQRIGFCSFLSSSFLPLSLLSSEDNREISDSDFLPLSRSVDHTPPDWSIDILYRPRIIRLFPTNTARVNRYREFSVRQLANFPRGLTAAEKPSGGCGRPRKSDTLWRIHGENGLPVCE